MEGEAKPPLFDPALTDVTDTTDQPIELPYDYFRVIDVPDHWQVMQLNVALDYELGNESVLEGVFPVRVGIQIAIPDGTKLTKIAIQRALEDAIEAMDHMEGLVLPLPEDVEIEGVFEV